MVSASRLELLCAASSFVTDFFTMLITSVPSSSPSMLSFFAEMSPEPAPEAAGFCSDCAAPDGVVTWAEVFFYDASDSFLDCA